MQEQEPKPLKKKRRLPPNMMLFPIYMSRDFRAKMEAANINAEEIRDMIAAEIQKRGVVLSEEST